ncbi:MAG: ribonuclease HI [Planctomycetales bacterium]|nr:ribonuclease HI [Planctomycetales bacterium]
MFRFSSTPLSELQTDVLVVDVHCIGGEPSEALRRCSAAFADVTVAYNRFFDAGKVAPGRLLVLPPTDQRTPTVFLAPSRIHPKSDLRRADVRALGKLVLEESLRRGFKSLSIFPPAVGGGLGEIDIRRELLYSFSPSPELDLVYLTKSNHSDPARRVSIFTDGGAEQNGGKGGYGAVLRFGDHLKELSAGFEQTTHNRMELMAAVVALEALKRPCTVRLHSDSRFLVDTVNTGLLFRRAADKWKAPKRWEADLWKRFLNEYLKHDVELIWIKGHAGLQDNDRCDQLATEAMQSKSLEIDTGFQAEASPKVVSKKVATTKKKPTKEGDPCQHCGHAMEKRYTKKRSPNAIKRHEWYLYCAKCKQSYHTKEAIVVQNT